MVSKNKVSVKKLIGSEKRENVLTRLGLEEYKKPAMQKFFMIEGIPCKMVNGTMVKLTKVEK